MAEGNLTRLIEAVKEQNENLTQPFMLLLNSSGSVAEAVAAAYVIVDFKPIEVTELGVAGGVEVLFSSFWCFNVSYPTPLNPVYLALEVLYGLPKFSCARIPPTISHLLFQFTNSVKSADETASSPSM